MRPGHGLPTRHTPSEHAHPTPALYVRVALILFVLTALEVGLYEITYGEHAGPARAHRSEPIFVPILLVLSAAKFALVAMFYMHLKQDSKLFSGVFVFPLIIAAVVIVALIALMAYHLAFARSGVMPCCCRSCRCSTIDRDLHPVRAGLVAAPQRPHRHRASRCLVLLGDRAAAPPPRPGAAPPRRGRSRRSRPALVLLFSLNGPMHDLSDYYLFSAHMVQHLVLTLVLPAAADRGNAGVAARARCSGTRRPRGGPGPDPAGGRGGCSTPATIAVWHAAAAYDLMMRDHDVHIATHLMFMVAATIMWWPVMSPSPELPRLAPGIGNALSLPGRDSDAARGRADHLADSVLYPWYSSAPRTWGLSPLDDQSSAACSCGCRAICGCSWRSACCSSGGHGRRNDHLAESCRPLSS